MHRILDSFSYYFKSFKQSVIFCSKKLRFFRVTAEEKGLKMIKKFILTSISHREKNYDLEIILFWISIIKMTLSIISTVERWGKNDVIYRSDNIIDIYSWKIELNLLISLKPMSRIQVKSNLYVSRKKFISLFLQLISDSLHDLML